MDDSSQRRAARLAVLAALLCAVGAAGAKPAEPRDAEFALRWSAATGGPATAAATLALLKLRATGSTSFDITYYDVPPDPKLPPAFSVIVRQRVEAGQRAELTWKLRGDRASPQWACPLRNPRKVKAEVDIAFGATDATRRYSYSCTTRDVESAIAALSARARPCRVLAGRWESPDLKVEEWHVAGGLVIEVSGNGANAADAQAQFRRRFVAPLLTAGVVPLADSKTELGSRCD